MLKKRDANKVLKNYNIGNVGTIKRLTSGYANVNYKITKY